LYTYSYVYKRIYSFKKRIWKTGAPIFASSIDRKIKFLFNPSVLLTNYKHVLRIQIFNIMINTIKNSVQLVGNIGKDVQLTTFDNGNKKATLLLATNESYTNAKGEKVKTTSWHNLIAWGKTAEQMAKSIQKGNEISIQGKLCNRTYADKDGNTKYITEIVVNEYFKVARTTAPVVEAVPF